MIIVKDKGVVISRGYRLEASMRNANELELAFYEKGKRKLIDKAPVCKIMNFQDAWRFIENCIGSSTNCDFTEEAVKMIFDK